MLHCYEVQITQFGGLQNKKIIIIKKYYYGLFESSHVSFYGWQCYVNQISKCTITILAKITEQNLIIIIKRLK